MSQNQFTTTRNERLEAAFAAVRKGRGVLVVDDEDRENEGDIIFSAASITHEQMALLIRECSGIVCLCLPEDKVRQLDLPQMVANNTCKNRTAFTISIEAAEGVTTGVSAADRSQRGSHAPCGAAALRRPVRTDQSRRHDGPAPRDHGLLPTARYARPPGTGLDRVHGTLTKETFP